jgi:hypothetical protein
MMSEDPAPKAFASASGSSTPAPSFGPVNTDSMEHDTNTVVSASKIKNNLTSFFINLSCYIVFYPCTLLKAAKAIGLHSQITQEMYKMKTKRCKTAFAGICKNYVLTIIINAIFLACQ